MVLKVLKEGGRCGSGRTSVVVAYAALVTPAQRPISFGLGMPMTPSWITSSSMILPSASGGAMCVTSRTASIIALCHAVCGL